MDDLVRKYGYFKLDALQTAQPMWADQRVGHILYIFKTNWPCMCVCVFHTYTSNYSNNNGGRDLDDVSKGDMWIHTSDKWIQTFSVWSRVSRQRKMWPSRYDWNFADGGKNDRQIARSSQPRSRLSLTTSSQLLSSYWAVTDSSS